MTIDNHSLLNEFPEHHKTIRELKMHNRHFAKLFDEYHEIDKQVHRVEEGIETTSDAFAEDLKKKRLHLKDELYQMIRGTSMVKFG